MQRWWNSADESLAALRLVDDSDPVLGVGTALLGYHGIAKAALADLSTSTLVDPLEIAAAMDEVDLTPVVKAITAAVADEMPAPEAAAYGVLMATDVHRRASEAMVRLTPAMVAKGVPWPRAVARAVEVVGVPLERLGRYPDEVIRPGTDALAAADAADRALMAWAGAVSKAIPFSSVSKAERERVRAAEPEAEHWDESEVVRDALGQFAEKPDEAARARRAARKARRARRAAAAARVSTPKEREAPAKAREVGGRAREVSTRAREAFSGARMSNAQAREAKANARPLERREEDAKQASLDEDAIATGAFGLPKRGSGWSDWWQRTPGVAYTPMFSHVPVDPEAGTEMLTAEDVLALLGGPEAFHGEVEYVWNKRAALAEAGLDDDATDEEFDEAIRALGPVTKDNFDPERHNRVLSLTIEDIENLPVLIEHEPGSVPLILDESRPQRMGAGYGEPALRSATVKELPPGAAWDTRVSEIYRTRKALAWVGDPGSKQETVWFEIPVVNQVHIANGVAKRQLGGIDKAERERTNESQHVWDESLVVRDAEGQFAEREGDDAKQRREARLRRKARRAKRRAREQAWTERTAQREQAPARESASRAREASTKARIPRPSRLHGTRARAVSAKARERQVTSDEYPIGLTMHGRKDAPDAGPYTLDEPMYSVIPVDSDVPTIVYTEEQMTQLVRSRASDRPNKTVSRSTYGEKLEEWHAPEGQPRAQTMYRYEPGTLPIAGRSPSGQFFTATLDQIDQNWSQQEWSGEGPVGMDFIAAAPGKKFDREPMVISVPVVYVATYFSKGEVSKRERERVVEREAENSSWDESKVVRDELGQFAEAPDPERIAAREARAKRKARRRKRAERAAAWSQREKTTEQAPAREASTRARQASTKARQASTRARVFATQARPPQGREMSAKARERLGPEEPPATWPDALLSPWNTALGKFIGQAGFKPQTTDLDWEALSLVAPDCADGLRNGESIAAETMFHEFLAQTGDTEDFVEGWKSSFGVIARNLDARTRLASSSLGAHDHGNIKDVAVRLLGDALDSWTPLEGQRTRHSVGPVSTWLRHIPDEGEIATLSIRDGEPVVYADEMYDPVLPEQDTKRPVVVSSQGALALRQMNAMMRVATSGGIPLDDSVEQLARAGWLRVRGRDATTIHEAPLSEVIGEVMELAEQAELTIHAIDDDALLETALLAMNKQGASEVRLDNRGVFLITTRLDTKNGWDRLAEIEKEA